MKLFPPLPRLLAGALVLLAATGSLALTLGRSQGVALIGRPLDLGVQLSLDAGADSSVLCAEADVFYGDNRVDGARVTTRIEQAGGRNAVARVRSTAVIDEPVVTVYLNVGCGQRVTRRYVLLSEQPGEAVSETPARAVVPATVPAVAAAAPAPVAVAAPVRRRSASAAREPSPADHSPAAARAQARQERAATARPAKAAAQPAARGTARLKLEPLDLSIEHDPSLKPSLSMETVPEASAERRAQAAALWKALNALPEDILRNAQRLQSLEGDVKTLRDAVQKNNASIAELRGELEQAKTERYANPLVYALAGLVLAAIAAALYAWRRGRWSVNTGRDWWRGRGAAGDSDFGTEFAASRPKPPAEATSPIKPLKGPDSAMDLDLSFTESVLDNLHSTPAVRSRPPSFKASRSGDSSIDFQHSLPSSLRAVKADEVHDVQQQADFFISLGEFDQAVDVLRSHINEHPETSAVAWLDLLDIYHRLKRREDYEATRQEFHDVFNAQAPSFETYGEHSGEGLQDYPQALSRIVALWPSAKVLDIIEESIFRRPGQDGAPPFGLQAYRELLLLFNIGKEVIESGESSFGFESSGGSQTSDFSHTSIQPLSAAMTTPFSRSTGGAGTDFPSIGLDINLDEPQAATPELAEMGAAGISNLLDFDLPDVDTQTLRPKKNGPA